MFRHVGGLNVRWFTKQFYVKPTVNKLVGYTVNASDGTTVSVKKRGGWAPAWEDAKILAGWSTVPPERAVNAEGPTRGGA